MGLEKSQSKILMIPGIISRENINIKAMTLRRQKKKPYMYLFSINAQD